MLGSRPPRVNVNRLLLCNLCVGHILSKVIGGKIISGDRYRMEGCMVYNLEMKKLLENINLSQCTSCNNKGIEKRKSENGEEYYRLKEGFCLPNKRIVARGIELTELEWDGNEIYISSSREINELMYEALLVLNQLERQMHNDYNNMLFDILLSVDVGDEDVESSITLRFYAIREDYHIIKAEELEEFSQPLLLCGNVNKNVKNKGA